MEASREFSRTPPHLPPCSDVTVFQKTRMSHFWDAHHSYHASVHAVHAPFRLSPKLSRVKQASHEVQRFFPIRSPARRPLPRLPAF